MSISKGWPSAGKLSGATLQWLAQDGRQTLMARTRVPTRTGSVDIQCFGCCWQMPTGEVIPQVVDFAVGESPSMIACVTYSTCDGQMGPYPTYPATITSPSPFSWDGRTVTATAATTEDLFFTSYESEVRISCQERERMVGGKGTAQACRGFLKKTHDPTGFWSASKACTQQVGDLPRSSKCGACRQCCTAVFSYYSCQRKNLDLISSDQRTCLFLCELDHCT